MVDSASTRKELPEPAVEPDLSGRELGDYRLLRRLGRGGMAEVYLADQTSLKRQVAIKILRGQLAGDEKYVQRFHFEAQAAASLVHANIVQIHEVGCVDGTHYIAQEYVSGQNLREFMVRHGPPDLRLAVALIRQVAAALHKAGERGIVHRDIKPENILLAQTGEVKVADFGLSRIVDPVQSMNLTQIGITMGTPLYMSPEQVEGKALDPRSDIYSLGVTCYHMLAGVPPFRGETALIVAVQHLKTQPERLENVRPDLPTALCRIVHKMLAKDPAHRYNTARELLKDLRTVPVEGADEWVDEIDGDASEVAAAVSDTTEATMRLAEVMRTESLAIPPRRQGLVLAAIVLGGLLIGGGIGLAARPPFLLDATGVITADVPKFETIDKQIVYAFNQVDSDRAEVAWLAVIEYFPDSQYEFNHRGARQQLARLYLNHDRLDEALELFNQFASLSEVEREHRSFGLAGRFVVLSLQNKHAEASAALEAWLPLNQDLNDQQMQRWLWDVGQANRAKLDREMLDQFEGIMQEYFPADNGDSPDAGPRD